MKAIVVQQFNEDPELVDLPVPEPGRGQLQVKLAAASVNPMDMAAATGRFAQLGVHRFPLVLGFDGAGTVSAIGDDVHDFAVGDQVFGQFWTDPIGYGTYTEYTLMAEQGANGSIVRIPTGVSMVQAAALPTAASTALGALDTVGAGSGDSLLIIGATGGVGTFAVQLAAARGLRVIATAAADADQQIRTLGADETINYKAHSLDRALAEAAPSGLDAIVDFTGSSDSIAEAARHLKDGRTVLSIAFGINDDLRSDPRIRAANYALDKKPERLAEVARLAGTGSIAAVINSEISLTEVPTTLRDRRSGGSRGKTVIRI